MIKDSLKNADTYYLLSDRLRKGFEWLKSQDLKNIPLQKYEIEGDKLYANVQEYETKTEAKYEAHRKYLDIQYMISGKEFVGVTDITNCTTCTEYNSDSDLEFFDINKENCYQVLEEGEFIVLYPHDAHKPSISPNEQLKVRKVVVKVAID